MSCRLVKIDGDRYLNIDRIDGILFNDGRVSIFVGGSDEPWTLYDTPEEFFKKIKNPSDSFTQEEKDMLSAALNTKCNEDYYRYEEIYDSIMRKIKKSPLWTD
jgi:hypothetical protein